MTMLFVFIGGALGALLRYLMLSGIDSHSINAIGVFIVNVLGCFVIGFVSYIAIKRHNILSENMKKFFTVGFAGGFTTFSAFTYPILKMIALHHYMYAIINIFFSVIIGLIFVSWGMNCGYYLMCYLIRSKKFRLE